jgi:hypothetical protein
VPGIERALDVGRELGRERELLGIEVADREVADRPAGRDGRTDLTGDAQHLGTDEALGEAGQRTIGDGGGGEAEIREGAQDGSPEEDGYGRDEAAPDRPRHP